MAPTPTPTVTVPYSYYSGPTITPLATIWAPPESCLYPGPTLFAGTCYADGLCTADPSSIVTSEWDAWANYAYWTTGNSQVNTECYPPGFQPHRANFLFSPARGCPSGYVTAMSSTYGYYGSAGDMYIECCPPGYASIQTYLSYADVCYSEINQLGDHFRVYAWGTTDITFEDGYSSYYETVSFISTTQLESLPTATSLRAYAQIIPMVVPSSWNTAAATTFSTYNPYATPTYTGSSSGVSIPATTVTYSIIISVVCFFLFCVCPCLTYCCIRRRRKRRYAGSALNQPAPVHLDPLATPTQYQGARGPYPSPPNRHSQPTVSASIGDVRPKPSPKKCLKVPQCASARICIRTTCCVCTDRRTQPLPLNQRLNNVYCNSCQQYWRQRSTGALPWLMPALDPVPPPVTVPEPSHPRRPTSLTAELPVPAETGRRRPVSELPASASPAQRRRIALEQERKSGEAAIAAGKKAEEDRRKKLAEERRKKMAAEAEERRIKEQRKKKIKVQEENKVRKDDIDSPVIIGRFIYPIGDRKRINRQKARARRAEDTMYASIYDEGPRHGSPRFQHLDAPGRSDSNNPFRKNRTSQSFQYPHSRPQSGFRSTLDIDSPPSLGRPQPEFRSMLDITSPPRVPSSSTLRSASTEASSSGLRSPSTGATSSVGESSSTGVSRAISPSNAEEEEERKKKKGKYKSLRYDGPQFDSITMQ